MGGKGKKTGGRDFQPGQSGNPNGRPPIPEDVRAIRTLNQVGFLRLCHGLATMTRVELTGFLADPTRTTVELAMAAQWIDAASGEIEPLKFLLERMLGKVPDKLQITDEELQLENMTDQELAALAKKAIPLLEKKEAQG